MGALFSQLMPPMKVIETRRPERLTFPRAGIHVFDFGQLFGGWIRIRLQGPAGAQVVIKHSSRLRPDGTIDDDAYPGPRESDTYVLRGDPGGEIYEPRFTFHPVHYVQITGLPRPPELADVAGKVVHTAVDPSGEFACSNELLNRIHRNVTWTMRNALKGFPMDCLHREPLGYNEPASVSSLLYTRRHMPLFWSKWLDDIKAARRPDGSLSDWAPELPGSNREHDAAQAGNYPPLVWYLYQYYEDERILADHYPVMRGWVDYLGTIAEDGLITTGWLGDHMLPGPAPGWEEYVAEETPPPLIWTGYYYRGALVVARAAEVLGRSEDAARYAALAEAIRGSFNAAYFDPGSGNYAAGSQTANAFTLALARVATLDPEWSLQRAGTTAVRTTRFSCHRGAVMVGHTRWLAFGASPWIGPRCSADRTQTARLRAANSSCSGYTDDNEIRTRRTDTLIRPASLICRARMVSKRTLQSRAAHMRMPGSVHPQLIGAHAVGEPVLHVTTPALRRACLAIVCRSAKRGCRRRARQPLGLALGGSGPRPSGSGTPGTAATPDRSPRSVLCDSADVRCAPAEHIIDAVAS